MNHPKGNAAAIRKLRVLIVENRPLTRQVHVDNVTRWGYEPVIAEGTGETLLQNALTLARTHCCHLALVDKRLRDDYDSSDSSGVQLIEQLRPTSTILVSGYTDFESTRNALILGATDMVAKKEGPKVVKMALDRAAKEIWHSHIQVMWPCNWSDIDVIKSLLANRVKTKHGNESEATYLIARLFPQATKVVLKKINTQNQTDALKPDHSKQQNSLIFAAFEDDKQPVIVKLANAFKVEKEIKNYESYVAGYIGTHRYPHMLHKLILWNLGGITYSLVGKTEVHIDTPSLKITTFSDLYHSDVEIRKLIQILNSFFSEVWHHNHQRRSDGVPLSTIKRYSSKENAEGELPLFSLYSDSGHDKSHKRALLREKCAQLDLSDVQGEISLPNPYDWAFHHRADSVFPQMRFGIIHGDLHGDDLLIDSSSTPWIVDFEATGYGHVLKDYVSLELDLLTNVADIPFNRGFTELCISLLIQTHPRQTTFPTKGIVASPIHFKIYNIIIGLREIAQNIALLANLREYYWALLLDSLNIMSTRDTKVSKERHSKLLLFSTLICQRLERWGVENWLPEKWPAIERGDFEYQQHHQRQVHELKNKIEHVNNRLSLYDNEKPTSLTEKLKSLQQELERLINPYSNSA